MRYFRLGTAIFCVSLAVGTTFGGTPDRPADDQFRIVFHDEQGNPVGAADLSKVVGGVGYEIVSDRDVGTEAQELHEKGRTAGHGGEHDRAIELFARATELDPEWPYPRYDAAFAYLLKGDAAAAEEHYRQVDRLAPRGFFTSKVAVDCLRREREGLVTPGVYLEYVLLELESDADKKRSVLMAILKDNPKFPPGWQLLAAMTKDPKDRLRAIEQGLSHSPDATTRGDLLIQKAIMLGQADKSAEAAAILRQVLSDPERTLENEAIATLVSAQIAARQ
ncbi:MAG: hypothetical protein GY720_08945 [bacterium]|nr:hypothetical protein [bacterium]